MNDIIQRLKNGCIVSCQALEDEPLFGEQHMAAMARAAEEGGAAAIRCNSPVDISAIKRAVSLPLIGLYKVEYPNSNVYITPTMKEVSAVAEAGAEMVAIDATDRPRPDGRTLAQLIADIRSRYPEVLIVADVSTLEEGLSADRLGADIISTTMSGYTPYSPQQQEPDFELLARLAERSSKPVLAEGRIWTPEDCSRCFREGAYAVVVGTAITRPREITRRFVNAVPGNASISEQG